jgi:DNA-binding NtrC family response regulator
VRVLVVDDDEGIRETLRSLLEDEGYEVSVAADGEEGLRAVLASEGPLVVLLDLLLPNLSGEEVLSSTLKFFDGKAPTRISFIIITANLQLLTPNLRAIMQSNNIPVAAKPFEADRLLAEIEQAAARAEGLIAS